jgi:hypothetical protein
MADNLKDSGYSTESRLMTLAHLQIYHSGKPNSHQFGPERSKLYRMGNPKAQ